MKEINIDNNLLFSEVLDMLKQGKKVMIPARGVSMLPLIKGGRDKIILEGMMLGFAERPSEVKVGDIVLFEYKGMYLIHRIISINNGIALIQGDGVCNRVEKCPIEKIYGRVTDIIRENKTINPNGKWRRFLSKIWLILPLRRYILAIYKRLPGNRWLLKES